MGFQRMFRLVGAAARPFVLMLMLALTAPLRAQAQDYVFTPGFGPFVERDGESIYTHICQGCHMPGGAGAIGAGAYPALANNPRLAAAAYPAALVLNGAGAMPSFAGGLDDEQVANVVNYIRSHFGNDYDGALTPEQVAAMRPKGDSPSE